MSNLSYTLTSTTLNIRALSTAPAILKPSFDRPMTITLVSSDNARKVEVKTSPNSSLFALTNIYTSTASQAFSVTAPIYDIKATGATGDKLEITQ
jgi:hypothetical protein